MSDYLFSVGQRVEVNAEANMFEGLAGEVISLFDNKVYLIISSGEIPNGLGSYEHGKIAFLESELSAIK